MIITIFAEWDRRDHYDKAVPVIEMYDGTPEGDGEWMMMEWRGDPVDIDPDPAGTW